MGRRSGRAAAKRAAVALENTPQRDAALGLDDEDDPMPDAAPGGEQDVVPEQEAEDSDKEEESLVDEDEAPEEDDDESPKESLKSPTPAPEPVVRRRRLGRPPKNRPPDWDTLPIERLGGGDSDATPRRRGRGGWRGRGGRKGQHFQPTQQSIDKDGTMLDIVNDELDLPEDPEGETKVDKQGHLRDGREYRCRTFTVAGREDRLYMLSTEPARCVGFRDSYLFFAKHKKLYKIIVNDDEKKDMIDRDIIPHSYKGRSIGIVTARSVFREFGSLIIVGGRKIIDDYEVAKAREQGAVEGDIADPNDAFEREKPYNKNQYVAWFGASSVYHSNGQSVPQASIKAGEVKKKRVTINDVNWQLEHAREASQFNSMISWNRRNILHGVYDVNTNLMLYPAIMQPTHARTEQIVDVDQPEDPGPVSSFFPPLKPIVSRNFLVADIYLETPPGGISTPAYDVRLRHSASDRLPVRTQENSTAPFRGLEAVPEDVRDLLPPECRRAFDSALEIEKSWFSKWGTEARSTCRREPLVDKAIVPYTMAVL